MKRTLRRDWRRIHTPMDNLVYFTPIHEWITANVYRDGSHWNWLVIGYPDAENVATGRPLILKHGTALTKNEACYYAEAAIPDDTPGEQLSW